MAFRINITRRTRSRRLLSGEVVKQLRFIVNYREPQSGKRRQEFFDRHKDALERRNKIVADYRAGTLVVERRSPTVADIISHWLANRETQVTRRTFRAYREVSRLISEPILVGSPEDRGEYRRTGSKPAGARFLPFLGGTKVADLSTAQIRIWHRGIQSDVGAYSAGRAKMFLRAALALAAEDFSLRPPAMPTGLGRGREKVKRAVLTPDQIAMVIKSAGADAERGIYLAFPFLTGVRPSELLGLLWEDIDFDASLIHVRRAQSDDGELLDRTKTEAGTRAIPMGPLLKERLLAWRVRCPRRGNELYRVFPGHGQLAAWPKPRMGGGGPLLYRNFLRRFWRPGLKRAGVPYVQPHSARHAFVSLLQAKGFEVALVAKLAGHASPAVTLSHYSRPMRGGEDAMATLEKALSS